MFNVPVFTLSFHFHPQFFQSDCHSSVPIDPGASTFRLPLLYISSLPPSPPQQFIIGLLATSAGLLCAPLSFCRLCCHASPLLLCNKSTVFTVVWCFLLCACILTFHQLLGCNANHLILVNPKVFFFLEITWNSAKSFRVYWK